MFKRRFAILLAALMLASLPSCSGSDGESPETGTKQDASSETDAAARTDANDVDFSSMSFIERIRHTTSAIDDNLPEKSYDGASFKIYSSNTSMPEELTGEALNDAQYTQKTTIEERFDVKVEYILSEWVNNWDGYVGGMQALFFAGDYFADLIQNWNTSTAGFVTQNFYTDLSQFSCIDTSKPWFFGDEMELYSYQGHMYVATGFMNTENVFNGMTAILYNKNIGNQYNVENLYDVVRGGRWTLDYVTTLCSDFYHDVNGDGSRDANDIYGLSYASAGSWMCTLATLGVPQIDKDAEGNLFMSVYGNAEKAQSIMDGMTNLTVQQGANAVSDWDLDNFLSGNALLGAYDLGQLSGLRDAEFDYGVLPPWKADETQPDYYTSYLPNPWSIPNSSPDPERAAILMTAYAAEGYKQVIPVCYENTIKTKYSTDEESGEMVDLMLNNVRADGMFLYGTSSYIYNLWNYMRSNQGFGSYWASQQKALESTFNQTIDALDAMLEKE
ncbi:MAG: hypothetical protein ACI4V1_02155 [Eubacteriales bacterium]